MAGKWVKFGLEARGSEALENLERLRELSLADADEVFSAGAQRTPEPIVTQIAPEAIETIRSAGARCCYLTGACCSGVPYDRGHPPE